MENAENIKKQRDMLPLAVGAFASLGLLGIYFGAVTLISGWNFARAQFSQYSFFITALALGFGVQVAIFTNYKRRVTALKMRGASGVIAASGSASGVAMLSCCAHYAANLVPILGVSGAITLIGQWQKELFWFGILANALGILYLAKITVELKRHI